MRKKNVNETFIKECISLALLDLMEEKSFNEIRITDICKKAGVGRTTYYRYFTNKKEDIIENICILRWQERIKDEPELFKENRNKLLLKHIYQYKHFFLLLQQQNLLEILFYALFKMFSNQSIQDDGLKYINSYDAGGIFGLLYQWIIDGFIYDNEEIEKIILTTILNKHSIQI
ncbi:MAG: TetR/AcrR family transcriptional regulator [Prevotella sp.]|nr:TetR/AcrR family transcriptional regulator [Staphylococcus sp.]MCM1349853.1 TetR/AcrR family transcriptional regulator [Prevotella sp.]